MKTYLLCIIVLLCSFSASATSYPSYSTGEVAGYFGWGSSTNSGFWTPRIPALPYSVGLPGWNLTYMYPTKFSNATLSVACNPLCAVGNTFSLDLEMSNFTLSGRQRPDAYPDLTIFVGTLNLITKPIVLKSSSGIALARFSLAGDLLGCTDAACGTPLFTLNVNTHAYVRIGYSLTGGQLSIAGISYILPEPSSMTLLGTGLALMVGVFRKASYKRSA